jgi:hypothetical protein
LIQSFPDTWTGYGLTAREFLKMNREVRFILKQGDYETIDRLWEGALWPYSAPNPEKATGNYIGAISRITTGVLQVKIIESDVSAEDKIRSAVFEFRINIPNDFPANPAFGTESVGCPEKFRL